jgi:hypothetical protein
VGDGRDPVRGHAGGVVAEAGGAGDDAHALALHAVAHVGRLREREAPHPAVHDRQIDRRQLAVRANAQLIGVVEGRAGACRGDERLRRNAVVEHACAAEPVAFHDRDFGAVLRGDQRRLVAGRAAAHDHDPGHHTLLRGRFPAEATVRGARLARGSDAHVTAHDPRCR